MITHSPPRRAAALLTTLAVAAGALLLPSAAIAAEGSAPAPREFRIIAGVHTDAVSTFLDDGKLALASKADVSEGNGTRFEASDIWFHLENASQLTLPTGFEFIGSAGETIWMAPESNPGSGSLWPGFNTESISGGAIDNDRTRFTLTNFEGPGNLEVFTSGAFGAPNRLWSSQDDTLRSFEIGRTHMHANWAFTAAGTYTLGVEGTVTIGGIPQKAQATYSFVVGDLPEPVATTTSLSASATTLLSGDPLTLTANVTPADAKGFIEFRNGTAVLGHEPVVGGTATFSTTAPAVGAHSLTAVYVPAVANLAATSVSDPVSVTVTDETGVEFGIAGVASTYAPGETLDARVVGHTPQNGEIYRWLWRQVGTTSAYVLTGGGQEAAGRLAMPVDMTHNGYEVSVQVRQGRQTVTQSSWIPITVHSDVQPLTPTFPAGNMYLGDELFVELNGTLAEGDSVRVAQRGTAGPWYAFAEFAQIDAGTLQFKPTWQSSGVSWTIQTVRNGVVVAQSAPVAKDVLLREVHVEGVQSVYRVGQTLRATARVYPELEGMTYTWSLQRSLPDAPYFENRVIKEGTTEADLSVELPIEASHQGWTLAFIPTLPEGHSSGATQVGTYSQLLNVSDSSPDTQLLFFEALGEHYHQGYDVNLNLITDPALADGDTIAWEWKWPGADWATLPNAAGLSHMVVAEQALHGVQVRATVKFAGGEEDLTAEPVTIKVDDHGGAPRQQVTITGDAVTDGAASFANGEAGSLSANVSTATVLDAFQWFMKLPGSTEATPIRGATSATYDFTASSIHDKAEVSVAVVKPDGSLAYGPSAPVSVTVTAAEEPVATMVTISGIEDAYRIGDTMSLTAVQSPDSGEDRWQWFVKPEGADEYAVVSGELTSSLTREIAANDDGASIIARLYNQDDAVIAESAPVTVSVTDDEEEPVSTTVTISGIEDSYRIGDTMSLSAVQTPDSGEDRWQWSIKSESSDEYAVILGEVTSSLTRDIKAADDGASIIARLYDRDHTLVAESAPVVVTVTDDTDEPVTGKPESAPVDRTTEDLGNSLEGGIELGSSTAAPGDFVEVKLGDEHANAWVAAWLFSTPALLGEDWAQSTNTGSITVQIPVDAPLGAHKVAVFATDSSLIGWSNLTVAQVGNPGPENPGGESPEAESPGGESPGPDSQAPGSSGSDSPGSGDSAGANLAVTGAALPLTLFALAILLASAGITLVVIRRKRDTAIQ